MPRYVAFLRGVSPANAKMADLRQALERGGFAEVTTVRSSGNVVFTTAQRSVAAVEAAVEQAIAAGLGRTFGVFARPTTALRKLLDSDPFSGFTLPHDAKRVVTFLRQAPSGVPPLPIELGGARILTVSGTHALSAYVPTPGDPAFMRLIERTLGRDVTTRTWDTIEKCAVA